MKGVCIGTYVTHRCMLGIARCPSVSVSDGKWCIRHIGSPQWPHANGSDHWAAEDELSQALLSLMTLLFETDILKLEFYVGYFQF